MKNIYEHFKKNPPLDANGNRKRGNSSQDGYWTGYDFPDRTPRGEAGSNVRLAWKAGKQAREDMSLIVYMLEQSKLNARYPD